MCVYRGACPAAPRRAHFVLFAVCAVAALLLLHALPPPPAPPARPAALLTTPPTKDNDTSPLTEKIVPSSVKTSTKNPPKDPRKVYTSDLYVSGHARPHPEVCPSLGAHLKLLILIASAPAHEPARNAIRFTWGHYGSRSDVAMAFFIGLDEAHQPAIDKEDDLYKDVIQGRFVDSYSNLTLKTLSMLEWVDTYCPRVPHILKTDDDMFINVPRLLAFAESRRAASNTIWGRVIHRSQPKRTTGSKYYMSPVQYPPKVYPDFATGPAYLITRDCIPKILKAAPDEPYLRLEDVFVTGLLATRLKIKLQHAQEFYNKRVSLHPCVLQKGVAIHMVRYHEQFNLWSKLLDGRTVCGKPQPHR